MKILFVTSSNPATNPRTVKEIELALKKGYETHLVYFRFNDWSKEVTDALLKNLPGLHSYPIDESRIAYRLRFGHIIQRFIRVLGFMPFLGRLRSKTTYHSDRSFYLMVFLRKFALKPDWVIAHTLAAFAPSYLFAKRKKCSIGLDVEDYHPGEWLRHGNSFLLRNELENRKWLMRYLLPKAQYVSYASPGILRHSQELLQGKESDNHIVIHNNFWQKQFDQPNPKENNSPLKLIWFSQNINVGRGLEQLTEALEGIEPKALEITLIGKLDHSFYDQYLQKHKEIVQIKAPLPQHDLYEILAEYDVGLALEVGSIDTNKQVAISNKIWAYYQSGLYVLATDTEGQSWFMEQFPDAGMVAETNAASIHQTIRSMIAQKDNIRQEAFQRYQHAKNASFEGEAKKLEPFWYSNKK